MASRAVGGMNKRKYLYMAVTADEYELPLVVTETLQEMSEITGRATRDISVMCSRSKRYRDGPPKRSLPGVYRYYRVILEED